MEPFLDGDRASYRIDGAGEVRQEGVPHGLDDLAPVFVDLQAKKGVLEIQEGQRAGLVLFHHLCIAHDVREHDSGQFALEILFRHVEPLDFGRLTLIII